MSNSLVLILASSHSGALASLIGRLPSLNCENVAGKLVAVIRSVSSLSVVSTLSTVRIGLVVSTWFDFHRLYKLFNMFCCFDQIFILWYKVEIFNEIFFEFIA